MKREDLREVINVALTSVLAAVGAAGCSGEDVLPPGIEGDPGFVRVECSGGSQRWLAGLVPAVPAEYTELRRSGTVIESLGTLCGGVPDVARCQTEFAALATEGGFRFGFCQDLPCLAQLAATQGGTAALAATHPELITFLAPIDTPTEAMLLVQALGFDVACDRGGAKQQGDGFQVQAFQYPGCGPAGVTRLLHHVDPAGQVSLVEKIVERKPNPGCAIGRRPRGLLPAAPCASRSEIARYFSEAARLEAASVAAFRRLRLELRLHGAPRLLLDLARRAAREEIAHARMVTGLARAFGAVPEPARVGTLPPRDLEAVASENAVEGCVRETYGALVASWQARTARDPAVRNVYAQIAEDELSHAALAWQVAEWLRPRLSSDGRARVEAVKADAVDTLMTELEASVDPELTQIAGVPATTAALALAEHMQSSLWARTARA